MGSITDKIVNLIKEEVKENDYKYYFGVADTQGYDMKVIKGDTYEEIFNKLDVDYERLDYYIEQEGLTEEQELTEENYKDFLQCYYNTHYYSILKEVQKNYKKYDMIGDDHEEGLT